MFQLALDHPSRPRYDLSSLRLVLWSGAGAAPALIEKLLDVAPLLATSYGLTESVGSATFTPPTRDMRELSMTVGVAAPHFQVRVVDDSDQDVAAGEPGEVLLKSTALFSGYWRNEEATRAAFDAQGWFRTGDIGALNAAGELRIIGRRGDRFKSGGYNVYPREIELVLERHPLVTGAAVIGVEDPLYGEVGEAFIATPEPTAIESTQLQAYCRDHLANYKVPKRFHLWRELPMLPIGKVDKQLLKRRALERI
jgi:acyl-CoA synthetase (AMP-forming)/AMP-acid ligase II